MPASMIQRVGIERIRASSPVGIGATQWVALLRFAYFSDVQNWKYADVMPPRISNRPKMMLIFHHRIVIDAPLRPPQLAASSYLTKPTMSPHVQVFGCRHGEPFQALWRPASKKRQGTKSRERLPASRLLPPRSGLERSDFVPWHLTDQRGPSGDVC